MAPRQTADALAILGGGKGTHREAMAALDIGVTVLAVIHGKPHPKLDLPALQRKATEGQLVIWKPGDSLPDRLAQTAANARQQLRSTRNDRSRALERVIH